MSLDGLGAVLYTTVGGIVGAGLTQYVTHLNDRRTARAAVVEKVAAAEGENARLNRTSGESGYKAKSGIDDSRLKELLASLESACIIAGVPRANVVGYAVILRLGLSLRSAVTTVDSMLEQTKRIVDGAADQLSDEEAARTTERMKKLLHRTEELKSNVSGLLETCSDIHNTALDELSRSVWHPLLVQLRRRKLRELEQRSDNLESLRREAEQAIEQGIVFIAKADDDIVS